MDPSNYGALVLYNLVGNQQTYGGMGHRLGVRFEALVRGAAFLRRQGEIDDAERAIRRALILDRVVNHETNLKLDMEIDQKQRAASQGREE